MYLIYGLIAWFVIASQPLGDSIHAPDISLPWWIIVTGCVILAFYVLLEGRSIWRLYHDVEYREVILQVYLDKAWLYPVGRRQVTMFYAVAIIVGIVEELFFRGYLTQYLMDFGLSWPWAAAILGILFGVGHFPQGGRAIVSCAIYGLLYWFVYAWSGSIWPAAVLHVLYDARIGYVSSFLMKKEMS